jgi:phosphatidylglycerophosphatase A
MDFSQKWIASIILAAIKLNQTIYAGYQRHQGHWFALGFGLGLMPYMPGTFGTLLALPLFALLSLFSWHDYGLFCFIFTVFSCIAAHRASIHLGQHDHQAIVADECCGMLWTLIYCPQKWAYYGLAFMLFRFFDIVKPFPIHWLDKHIKGGLGIVLDDLVAALFAWLTLHGILLYTT